MDGQFKQELKPWHKEEDYSICNLECWSPRQAHKLLLWQFSKQGESWPFWTAVFVTTLNQRGVISLNYNKTGNLISLIPELANVSEGACPNCLQISKKCFRVPVEILKRNIRFWSLLQLLFIAALFLLVHIIINA